MSTKLFVQSRPDRTARVVVCMKCINDEWYVYDSNGEIGDQNGTYIDRLGKIDSFVRKYTFRVDGNYVPMVMSLTSRNISEHLNELEWLPRFPTVPNILQETTDVVS